MFLKAQSFEQDLQAIFEDFELMGLSVGVAVNGASESFHFGIRDFDRLLEVNENTKFRIASVSKSFTALGVMKLFDQGLSTLTMTFPITFLTPLKIQHLRERVSHLGCS